MPVALEEFAKTLPLPAGYSAFVVFYLDGIEIRREGKKVGFIGRAAIDDNVAQRRLKEIIDGDTKRTGLAPDGDRPRAPGGGDPGAIPERDRS